MDLISRQAAIEALGTITVYKGSIPFNTAMMRIKQLPPANIAEHIEAINTAIRALGGKATMAEVWRWAEQPGKEVNQ